MKFVKTLTWQEVDPEASKIFSAVGSHVICVEGRDGSCAVLRLAFAQMLPRGGMGSQACF